MAASAQRRTDEVFRVWQRRIFVTTWVTYGSLYLGRVNLAAASKALEMDFGWSNVAIGLFGSVYAATHAVGQFANGWIADRVGARRLLTAGIFTAAAAQILFATRPGYAAMLALWAVNAYAMATGWPSCLKTLAAWFPAGARGTVMGWWSTCYQVGGVAGTALAGFLIGRDPTLQANRWPLAFLVPGCVLLLFAAHFALRTRDDPCAAGLSPLPASAAGADPPAASGTGRALLRNPVLWTLALACLFLNVVRWGFINWVPKYLQEVRGLAPDGAAYVALVLPLAGAVGAVGAGWLSDRFFAGRRGPVATALLALLAVSVWAYGRLDTDSWLLDVLVLGSIGVCTYGPDMLLAAAGTLDVGPPRGAAAAVGFVNGIGYFGAILAGAGLGVVVDWLGWGAAFHCLVGAAAAAALVASTSCWWPSPTAR